MTETSGLSFCCRSELVRLLGVGRPCPPRGKQDLNQYNRTDQTLVAGSDRSNILDVVVTTRQDTVGNGG